MPVRKDGLERTVDFMEINKYRSIMTAYAKNTYEPSEKKTGGSASAKASENTDKAVFSSASVNNAIAGAKASAAKSVLSFASPERIAALKAMIADGSYNIPAESVASSILEG